MRTIKELLELMLPEMRKSGLFTTGLCLLASKMQRRGKIIYLEMELIKEYINDNGPKALWDGDILVPASRENASEYWRWKISKRPGRIAWLKKHIKLNS